MPAKDLQHFALDESGKVTEIKDSRPESQYFCPACRDKMIRKCGKVRQWHFAHLPDTKCNPDYYLHKLAELKIKEHFDKAGSLFVKLEAVCGKKEDCVFGEKCSIGEEFINLRDFYDTCEIEKGYKGFVADLLLTNSKHPNWEPVFLEVFVTHKCEPEKINSGIRIVEIKIEKEADIDRFIHNKAYDLNDDYDFESYEYNRDGYQTFNFKPIKTKLPLDERVNVTSLFQSGKSFTDYVSCKELANFSYRNSRIQLLFHDGFHPEDSELMMFQECKTLLCLVKAQELGMKEKSCNLCKYCKGGGMLDDYPICALYKKMGTQREITNPLRASQCQYYRDNFELIGKLKQILQQVPYMYRLPNEDWKVCGVVRRGARGEDV